MFLRYLIAANQYIYLLLFPDLFFSFVIRPPLFVFPENYSFTNNL